MSGTLVSAPALLDAAEFSCAICIDLLVDPVVGTCGHDFCRVCYETWLAKATLCPLCRQQLSTTTPGVCRRLANLIAHTFPAQLAQRREDLAAAGAAEQATAQRGEATQASAARAPARAGAAVHEMQANQGRALWNYLEVWTVDSWARGAPLSASSFLRSAALGVEGPAAPGRERSRARGAAAAAAAPPPGLPPLEGLQFTMGAVSRAARAERPGARRTPFQRSRATGMRRVLPRAAQQRHLLALSLARRL